MKKTIFIFLAAAVLASCEMDFYRSDTMTSSQLGDDPGAAVYTTDGNYALFKDILMYNNSEYSNNTYVRHWFQMTEFRGDNICLSGQTEDPLYNATAYTDNNTLYNLGYFWYVSYKIIYGANANIESIKEGVSVESDHMLGENYFMRAICHLNLVNLFALPYSRGSDNPGVVLRTSTDCSVTEKATIGQIYEQVVRDLEKAAQLMQNGSRRGNKGYISYETARGLLTRVYLHMGMNEECINLANEMLGNDPSIWLDPDVANYFIKARESVETLWCVGKTSTDAGYTPKSQIGSMYYSDDSIGGTGWCEIYYSDPLIELFNRYPEDLRFQSYFGTIFPKNDGSKMVHWPADEQIDGSRRNIVLHNIRDNNDGTYSFTYSGTTYTIQQMIVNSYPVHYVVGLMTDEEDKDIVTGGTQVFVRDDVNAGGVRDTYPAYTMSKFSWQDGDPMLSSPVMIRYAEVILNRAEALAKSGRDADALNDVNIIRQRAGLSGDALMTLENYQSRGYETVLDVVLDERRLELCFEGFRALDLYRNGRSIDRRFAGSHVWEVLTPEQLDTKFPYFIPFGETSVSGITSNK